MLISRLRPPCVAIYGAARGWAKIRKKIDKNLNSATFFFTTIPVHLHLKKRSTYKSAGNGPIFGDLPAGGGWCGPGLVRAIKGKKKALAWKRRAVCTKTTAICLPKLRLFDIYQPFTAGKFAGFLIIPVDIPGAGSPRKGFKAVWGYYIAVLPGPLSAWLKKNCCAFYFHFFGIFVSNGNGWG